MISHSSPPFRRSEPCLRFGIQSHHLLQFGIQSRVFVLAFKVIIQLGIWCYHLPLVLTFRVVMHTHFDILSRHLSSFLAFRVAFPQPCHSKSRLLTSIFTGIVHLTFMVLRSSLVFPHLVTLCLSLIHHALLNFPSPCT